VAGHTFFSNDLPVYRPISEVARVVVTGMMTDNVQSW
jgi:hypothetical protein